MLEFYHIDCRGALAGMLPGALGLLRMRFICIFCIFRCICRAHPHTDSHATQHLPTLFGSFVVRGRTHGTY